MLRPKWPPKEITKDFLSWILREVIPSLLCWTLESLGQNWGLGRWFEGWSKGDKTYGSKHEQSTECISYNVLLKGNGLYAKKKTLRIIVKLGLWGASICKPSVAPRRQYVPEPFHYCSPSGSQRIYLNSMHGGAFGWYIHKCEEMRGLKISREYPAMYVGEHYWQDGQPLVFFGWWNSVFSHGQELQGESSRTPPSIWGIKMGPMDWTVIVVVWLRITHHWRIFIEPTYPPVN